MDQFTLNLLVVGFTFAIYIGIAIWARAGTTAEFYAAGQGVPPVMNGMATGADWMSAASFISMAGLIAFGGYENSAFLMGWTGGYVLLALLLAPYLRKFGKFTVPDFVGDRYYSDTARLVAVVCAIVVSFVYVAGQMRGVGVVFSRFLEISVEWGVVWGMAIVFFYAVLGGIGGVLLASAVQIIRTSFGAPDVDDVTASADRPARQRTAVSLATLGGGIGLLSGLTGVGGGVFLTPALLALQAAPVKIIAAVTAPFILVNSLAGLAGGLLAGRPLQSVSLPVIAAAVLGGAVGSQWGAFRLPVRTLRLLMAGVLLFASVKLLSRPLGL